MDSCLDNYLKMHSFNDFMLFKKEEKKWKGRYHISYDRVESHQPQNSRKNKLWRAYVGVTYDKKLLDECYDGDCYLGYNYGCGGDPKPTKKEARASAIMHYRGMRTF